MVSDGEACLVLPYRSKTSSWLCTLCAIRNIKVSRVFPKTFAAAGRLVFSSVWETGKELRTHTGDFFWGPKLNSSFHFLSAGCSSLFFFLFCSSILPSFLLLLLFFPVNLLDLSWSSPLNSSLMIPFYFFADVFTSVSFPLLPLIFLLSFYTSEYKNFCTIKDYLITKLHGFKKQIKIFM